MSRLLVALFLAPLLIAVLLVAMLWAWVPQRVDPTRRALGNQLAFCAVARS